MTFADLAGSAAPALEDLALGLAAELGEVDADGARAELDRLGALLATVDGAPADRLVAVLGDFTGDREDYDNPRNSMLDVVLRRRRGLPILLSTVYIAVGARAGVAVDGVGLPGHFVVAVGGQLLDPFNGGGRLDGPAAPVWPPKAIAVRMLNNLVGSYQRRGDVGRALRAAELRTALPADPGDRGIQDRELLALRARLN